MSIGNNLGDDLANLENAPAITFSADFFLAPEDAGTSIPVFWNTGNFYLLVSDGVIRAGLRLADGSVERFFARDTVLSDFASHNIELLMDSDAGTFRVSIDGTSIFSRSGLDFALPADLTGTKIGTAPGRGDASGNLSNIAVSAVALSEAALQTLRFEGQVSLTFEDESPPIGLILKGDAAISKDGVLALDGDGDYAALTERYSLDGADYLSVELDFRYSDAADIDNARLIWNHGAFGVRVNDQAISIMYVDDKGQANHIWRGGLDFTDLDWHHLALSIDAENGVLAVAIDNTMLVEETGLGLSLPSTGRQTTIGSGGWGSSLNGEIDNVRLSTERPQEAALDDIETGAETWDAVGLANPAIAMNTTGYIKWAESSAATFIDRMKGSYAWTGQQEILYSDSGSYHIFRDVSIWDDPAAVEDVVFSGETLLNLHHLLSISHWSRGLIDYAQYSHILSNSQDYFKIETGASGNSELFGRLFETDEYTLLARFDRDIGIDLATLRDNGQVWIRPGDLGVPYSKLDMDENGWIKSLPTNAAGGTGTASTVVLWHPEETGQTPGNIYSGTFYLLAEGQGTIDLTQRGQSGSRINLRDIEIDGPTIIPFEYTPDGYRVTLTITSSDPDNTGEYVRNISIVHESHMELFEAGEIFTPEFVELHADSRAVRWMTAQDANRIVPGTEGTFDEFHTSDFYTFNTGTKGTPRNGVPIDAIIDFANKTGSDPWINVHVTASDDYVRGMAEYIEANLDPRLTLYLEFGNENWNGVFPTYHTSTSNGLERWGELQLDTDADGNFIRDANGDLVVLEDGYFFSFAAASANGYRNLNALAAELDLGHGIYHDSLAWAEWSSFRAVEVASIVDEVFAAADPDNADARVNKVMGALTNWAKSTDFLMQANVWREAEPGEWIDPASVFDSLAVGGYFGGTAGYKHADLVRYWIDTYGEEQAGALLIRQLKADADPEIDFIGIKSHHINTNHTVKAAGVHTGVTYSPDLIIDVYDAIFGKNPSVQRDIQIAAGVQGAELLVGADVHNYVRLETGPSGNTVLQLRIDPVNGSFETVVEFDSLLNVSIEEMLHDGTLFVRSLPSIDDIAQLSFGNQKVKADAYDLELIVYEGGQHLTPATWGIFGANLSDPTLTNFFIDLNQSAEIGEVYEYLLDAWEAAGGELFAHFSDYGTPSRFGTWGSLSYLGEQHEAGAETHRFDALNAVNERGAWWDDGRDPTAFLHGITDTGTPGDDSLRGTSEEDILLGGDGDDLIQAGPGDDTISGGAGANTIEAGDGDDSILVTSEADIIDGGDGFDTIRLSSAAASLDLSLLSAENVEAIDTRNNARSTVSVSTADVFAFSPSNGLKLYMETADTLELSGFAFKSSSPEGPGEAHLYEGIEAGETVSVEVITNISEQPDVLLMA